VGLGGSRVRIGKLQYYLTVWGMRFPHHCCGFRSSEFVVLHSRVFYSWHFEGRYRPFL
jgi:hypothetical protein